MRSGAVYDEHCCHKQKPVELPTFLSFSIFESKSQDIYMASNLDMCRVFSKVLEFARLVSDGVSQGRDGGGQQDPVAAMLEAAQGRAPGGPPPGQQASGCVAQTYRW